MGVHTLEPPRRGSSNEYWSKNKKYRYTPAYPSLVGFKGVFIARTCFPDVATFAKMGYLVKCLNICSLINRFVCLFVLRFNVLVNNFSVMSGRSHRFLGFN